MILQELLTEADEGGQKKKRTHLEIIKSQADNPVEEF